MTSKTVILPPLDLEFLSQKQHLWRGQVCYFKILNRDFIDEFDPEESYNPIWKTDKGDYLIQHPALNYENIILTKGKRYMGKYKMVPYQAKGVKDDAYKAVLLAFREVAEEKDEDSKDPFKD